MLNSLVPPPPLKRTKIRRLMNWIRQIRLWLRDWLNKRLLGIKEFLKKWQKIKLFNNRSMNCKRIKIHLQYSHKIKNTLYCLAKMNNLRKSLRFTGSKVKVLLLVDKEVLPWAEDKLVILTKCLEALKTAVITGKKLRMIWLLSTKKN